MGVLERDYTTKDRYVNHIGRKWGRLYLTLLFLLISLTSYGQSKFHIQYFGSEIGGTLLTSSLFANPVSSQYRFFVIHDIDHTLLGEINAGFGFLSNPMQRSRLFDLEYRLQYPLATLFNLDINTYSRLFRPYLYAGAGVSKFQRLHVDPQADPLLRESGKISNSSIWNNGGGWVIRVPVGVGADFQLDDITAVRLTAGYQMLAGQTVVKNSGPIEGFLGATLGLSFRPFGADWDKDRIPTIDEMRTVSTFPDNPDSDGDGLLDGEEFYFYKTNPLEKDTDGDGLSDGEEIKIYKTNPLLVDTDGGLMADGEEVVQSTNPLDRTDDRRLAVFKFPDTAEPQADKIDIYRSFAPIYYETLEFGLKESDKRKLSKVFALLRDNANLKVRVNGYTDIRGNEVMNRSLSNARSWEVVKYMLERGIPFSQLMAKGYGESATGSSDGAEHLAENRKTDTYLGYRFSTDYSNDSSGLDKDVEIDPSSGYLLAPSAIQFDLYSDQLTKVDRNLLSEVSVYLMNNPDVQVQIAASGDPHASPKLNKMLITARESALARFLMKQSIEFNRIEFATDFRLPVRTASVKPIENSNQ